jgi:hypothetical protein
MIQVIKKALMSLSVLSLLLVPALVPATVGAQEIQDSLNCGANLDVDSVTDGSGCELEGDDAGTKLNDIVKLVINIFSVVVAIVAVIMIIIGGLKYIMSGGDSGNITGAKNTILYAIIGLVIVALAQFIVRFVLEKVSGTA